MSETKKFESKTVAKTEIEKESIEAKEVILNIQRAAKSLDEVIDQDVKHKYPKYHIAKPSQEEARQGHKGWKYLKFNSGTLTLEEVDSIDKATCTTGTVLCWRLKTIQDYIDSEERKARDLSNRRANQETSASNQAKALNDQLVGMGGGKVRATPLDNEE
jgi:hypothetical protein